MKPGVLFRRLINPTASAHRVGVDAVFFMILAVVSLEINVPYILDQLDFHHCMPLFGSLSALMVPGGADGHPLVMLGHAFVPLKLMIRTLTLAAVLLYFALNRSTATQRLRMGLILFVIVLHVVIPLLLIISARMTSGNHALAHDGGVIQMEEAMKMVVHGRNPYHETFAGTPLENWRGFRNNVIYHVPYMPGAFLYSLPFFGLLTPVFHGYDQRIFYLLLFLLAIPAILKTVPRFSHRMAALSLFALNPFFTKYFLLGANDIVIMTALLWSFHFLDSGRRTRGFLCLAAACGVKQFAWFFVPFFFIHAYPVAPLDIRSWWREIGRHFREILPGILLFTATVAPFVLADFNSFIADTFLYGSGGLPTSYPMQGMHGYGFATVLLFFRLVPDGSASFPFLLIQAPLLLFLIFRAFRSLVRDRSPGQILFHPAFLLAVFMYFSRYFHGNFVGFVLFWLGYAWCMSGDSGAMAED